MPHVTSGSWKCAQGHERNCNIQCVNTPNDEKERKHVAVAHLCHCILRGVGDKTQLATLLFAADPQMSRVGVFCASAGALVLSSLLAVLVGGQLSAVVSPRVLKLVAGIGFVVIGGWMLFEARS